MAGASIGCAGREAMKGRGCTWHSSTFETGSVENACEMDGQWAQYLMGAAHSERLTRE
jgi:hypothetical protein